MCKHAYTVTNVESRKGRKLITEHCYHCGNRNERKGGYFNEQRERIERQNRRMPKAIRDVMNHV